MQPRLQAWFFVVLSLACSACHQSAPVKEQPTVDLRQQTADIAQIVSTSWCQIKSDRVGTTESNDRTGRWINFGTDGKITWGQLALFNPIVKLQAYSPAPGATDLSQFRWTMAANPPGAVQVTLITQPGQVAFLARTANSTFKSYEWYLFPAMAIVVDIPDHSQGTFFPCGSMARDFAESVPALNDPIDLIARRGLDREEEQSPATVPLMRSLQLVPPIVPMNPPPDLEDTDWCAWSMDDFTGDMALQVSEFAVNMKIFVLTFKGNKLLHRGYSYKSDPPAMPGQVEPLAVAGVPENDIGFTLPQGQVFSGDRRLEEYRVVDFTMSNDGVIHTEGVRPDFELVQDSVGTKSLLRLTRGTPYPEVYNYFNCRDERPAVVVGRGWISNELLDQLVAKQRAQFDP